MMFSLDESERLLGSGGILLTSESRQTSNGKTDRPNISADQNFRIKLQAPSVIT